jgi:hypothetical protein
MNYLPGMASNLDSPDLCLLSSWDYRRELLTPNHFALDIWRWGLENYLPGLASNSDPPNLSLLSRWDYRREPLVPG